MACGMDFDRPKIDGLPHPVRTYFMHSNDQMMHSNDQMMGDKLAGLSYH